MNEVKFSTEGTMKFDQYDKDVLGVAVIPVELFFETTDGRVLTVEFEKHVPLYYKTDDVV